MRGRFLAVSVFFWASLSYFGRSCLRSGVLYSFDVAVPIRNYSDFQGSVQRFLSDVHLLNVLACYKPDKRRRVYLPDLPRIPIGVNEYRIGEVN